ncbi:MAG: Acyl-CoA reductase [Verrucomicrobia bacterium]|nr:MAG: Acyl-CoA reductase [Verrucomicrobiota bacterium]
MIEVRSPWSGALLGVVPFFDEAGVDRAIRELAAVPESEDPASAAGFDVTMSKAAVILSERGSEAATLISKEQGKPLVEAREEVSLTVGLLESFSRAAYRLGQQFQPLAAEARIGDRFGFTRQRPVGINALFTPNTFPLLIPAKLLLASLAAANRVVLKPSSATPLTAQMLLEVLGQAGLNLQTVALLTGPGQTTGQAICRHPLIDHLSCQCAPETLGALRGAIGAMPLRYCHGGSAVCLIAADADLDRAVTALVRQRFENAGQTAISAGTVYVEASVAAEFTERLVVAVRQLPVGDPLAPETRIGPLAERSRVAECVNLMGALTTAGARLVTGGACLGSVVAPIVLAEVPPRHPALWNGRGYREILGPVLTVTSVPSGMAEIGHWLDRRTQPVVSIFSQDLDWATRLANSLPVFNVHLNGIPTWRDGVVSTAGSGARLGRRQVDERVNEVSMVQDLVFHPV